MSQSDFHHEDLVAEAAAGRLDTVFGRDKVHLLNDL